MKVIPIIHQLLKKHYEYASIYQKYGPPDP